MKNATFASNIENGIIQLQGDACNIRHYAAPHNGNRPVEIEQTMIRTATIENAEVDTFAHPMPVKKRRIVKTVEETGYLHRTERICYTLSHADMNVMKIEQNRIFVSEIVKPKAKRFRRKKCPKRKNREDAWKWDDLCFQPEIEPKYDCNVQPKDYVQFLNNPICDPMFCQLESKNGQFDISNNKSNSSAHFFSEYDEYE